MKLQEWVPYNSPNIDMLWRDAFYRQINFVFSHAATLFATDYESYTQLQDNIEVVSTHKSKSVVLPVYQFTTPKGIVITMRANFHDWKISVDSPEEIDVNFRGLFRDRVIPDYYCEGFPKDLVYGPYSENKKQFTVELSDEYKVYTFLWSLK